MSVDIFIFYCYCIIKGCDRMEKQAIIDKITERVDDKDLKIELLEDIADSTAPSEEMIERSKYDELVVELELYKKKYEDLQDKYISRFGNSESVVPNEAPLPEEVTEEEEKVIDVEDIFKEEDEEKKEEEN